MPRAEESSSLLTAADLCKASLLEIAREFQSYVEAHRERRSKEERERRLPSRLIVSENPSSRSFCFRFYFLPLESAGSLPSICTHGALTFPARACTDFHPAPKGRTTPPISNFLRSASATRARATSLRVSQIFVSHVLYMIQYISILITRRDQKSSLITQQRAANSLVSLSFISQPNFLAAPRVRPGTYLCFLSLCPPSFSLLALLFLPFFFPSPATLRRCLRINGLETR